MVDDPYAAMTDVQVLKRAGNALKKVAVLPVGSVQRAIQWSVYESAMREMDRRFVRHVRERLRR